MLDNAMVIEISGADAGRILHNLTTNHVQALEIGTSLETFVTDVRGWVVAHGIVFRQDTNCWWLIGQHPSTSSVVQHIDRYIIREKATVVDRSASFRIDFALHNFDASSAVSSSEALRVPFNSFEHLAELHLIPIQHASTVSDSWTRLRIAHFWPLMGVDIWEKCIPQELDRNDQAISFTKGCYLGQETIARLDARGQIQKKLSLIKLDGAVSATDSLLFNDQEVGHITSVSNGETWTLALAVIRRGFFELDTRLTCKGYAAQVINSQAALELLGKT